MITIKNVSENEWLVTVDGTTCTDHRVGVSDEDAHRFGQGRPVEELLRASFAFLLEREPNTSILSRFELPVIGRYFPEYEGEMKRRLKRSQGRQGERGSF